MIDRSMMTGPETRIVSAVWGELQGMPCDAIAAARSQILKWMSVRTTEKLPKSAYRGEGFSLLLGNGEAVVSDGIWALRFDTSDEELKEQQSIERRWRTEAVIANVAGHSRAFFALRLSVVTDRSGVAFARSAPSLIKSLAIKPGLVFDSIEDRQCLDNAEALVAFLEDKERRPVVLVSESDDGSFPVDLSYMSLNLTGFAHVIPISQATSKGLTRRLGRKWSVFGGAIRAYMPGVDIENQEHRKHPLWIPNRIPADAGEQKRFVRYIQGAMLALSAHRPDLDDVAPGFATINAHLRSKELNEATERLREASRRAQNAATETDRATALEVELLAMRSKEAALENELASVRLKLSEAVQERDYAYETSAEHEAEIHRLRGQFFAVSSKASALEARLTQVGSEMTSPIVYPDNFDDLTDFALKYFPDRLIILPKAQKLAKKAVFSDFEIIYRSLHLLATHYVDMRRGVDGAKNDFDSACDQFRVEVSGVGRALENHRYRDQFRAPYKAAQIEFDMHLAPAKGTSARGSVDPVVTYRIYFAWDYEDQVVVIGSLPAHLDTTLTT